MKALRSSVSASARRIFGIVERRRLAVDDQVHADAALAHGADRLGRVVPDVLQQRHRDVGGEGHVELAGDERQHARRAVGHDGELDAVEIGQALLPVVGVLHQLDALVHLELGELERAGADRLAPHLVGRHVAGIDRRVARGEQRHQRGLRRLEMERGLGVAVGGDLLDVGPPGRTRIAPELGLALAAQQQVEGAGDVLGAERLAVVPLHALAQGEHQLPVVVLPLPLGGEVGHDRLEAVLRRVLVEHHEVVVERHERHGDGHRRLLVDRGAGRRVHVLDPEHAAGFLRRDRTAEAQRRREDEQGKTSFFGFHCFLPRRRRA